jgi:hypothetical protein
MQPYLLLHTDHSLCQATPEQTSFCSRSAQNCKIMLPQSMLTQLAGMLLLLLLVPCAGFWRAVPTAHQASEQARDSQQQQHNRACASRCMHTVVIDAMQLLLPFWHEAARLLYRTAFCSVASFCRRAAHVLPVQPAMPRRVITCTMPCYDHIKRPVVIITLRLAAVAEWPREALLLH